MSIQLVICSIQQGDLHHFFPLGTLVEEVSPSPWSICQDDDLYADCLLVTNSERFFDVDGFECDAYTVQQYVPVHQLGVKVVPATKWCPAEVFA